MTSEVQQNAVPTAFPLVIPTLANRPLAKLLLRNDVGQIVQQWFIRQNKVTLGSAAGCVLRCNLPGIAPYHALVVVGAKQAFIRALAPKLTRDGAALNELLVGADASSFEIAGHRFELLRQWKDPDERTSASPRETDTQRLKFTLARPFALQNRTTQTAIEDSAANFPATAARGEDSTWVAKLVQAALEPLELQIQNALSPLAELQADSRRQKRRRKRRLEQLRQQREAEREAPDLLSEMKQRFELAAVQQSTSIEALQDRLSEVNYQLQLIERLVAEERVATSNSSNQLGELYNLNARNAATLEQQQHALDSHSQSLAGQTQQLVEQRLLLNQQIERLQHQSDTLQQVNISLDSQSDNISSQSQSIHAALDALRGQSHDLSERLDRYAGDQTKLADIQNNRLDELSVQSRQLSSDVSQQIELALRAWNDRHAELHNEEIVWKKAITSQLDAIQSRLAAAMSQSPSNVQLGSLMTVVEGLQSAQSMSQAALSQWQSDFRHQLSELQQAITPAQSIDVAGAHWADSIAEKLSAMDSRLAQAQEASNAWKAEIIEQLTSLTTRYHASPREYSTLNPVTPSELSTDFAWVEPAPVTISTTAIDAAPSATDAAPSATDAAPSATDAAPSTTDEEPSAVDDAAGPSSDADWSEFSAPVAEESCVEQSQTWEITDQPDVEYIYEAPEEVGHPLDHWISGELMHSFDEPANGDTEFQQPDNSSFENESLGGVEAASTPAPETNLSDSIDPADPKESSGIAIPVEDFVSPSRVLCNDWNVADIFNNAGTLVQANDVDWSQRFESSAVALVTPEAATPALPAVRVIEASPAIEASAPGPEVFPSPADRTSEPHATVDTVPGHEEPVDQIEEPAEAIALDAGEHPREVELVGRQAASAEVQTSDAAETAPADDWSVPNTQSELEDEVVGWPTWADDEPSDSPIAEESIADAAPVQRNDLPAWWTLEPPGDSGETSLQQETPNWVASDEDATVVEDAMPNPMPAGSALTEGWERRNLDEQAAEDDSNSGQAMTQDWAGYTQEDELGAAGETTAQSRTQDWSGFDQLPAAETASDPQGQALTQDWTAFEVEQAHSTNDINSLDSQDDRDDARHAEEPELYGLGSEVLGSEVPGSEVPGSELSPGGAEAQAGPDTADFEDVRAAMRLEEAERNEAESALGLNATAPSLAESEAGTQASEEEEDSVEDYMRKLLARMRGVPEEEVEAAKTVPPTEGRKVEGQTNPSISAPASKTASSTLPWQSASTSSATTGVDGEAGILPFDPDKYVPRALAPEASRDLNAMRELANNNARTAIYTSSRQRYATSVAVKLSVAGVGLLVGSTLLAINGLQMTIGLIAALASFVVAAIWGFDGIHSMKPLLQSNLVLQPPVEKQSDAEQTD